MLNYSYIIWIYYFEINYEGGRVGKESIVKAILLSSSMPNERKKIGIGIISKRFIMKFGYFKYGKKIHVIMSNIVGNIIKTFRYIFYTKTANRKLCLISIFKYTMM